MNRLAKSSQSIHAVKRVSVYEANILAVLTTGHSRIRKLFMEFENVFDPKATPEKSVIVNRICAELIANMAAEEEVFYPAIRKVLDDQISIYEAEIEHSTIHDLIWKIISGNPLNPLYKARMRVLDTYVRSHGEYEEAYIFPKIRRSNLNLLKLGVEFTQRRTILLNALIDPEGGVNVAALRHVALKTVTINWV